MKTKKVKAAKPKKTKMTKMTPGEIGFAVAMAITEDELKASYKANDDLQTQLNDANAQIAARDLIMVSYFDESGFSLLKRAVRTLVYELKEKILGLFSKATYTRG